MKSVQRALFLLSSLGGQPSGAAEEETAIIRILVSTTFGESAGTVQAVLTSVGPKEQFKQR